MVHCCASVTRCQSTMRRGALTSKVGEKSAVVPVATRRPEVIIMACNQIPPPWGVFARGISDRAELSRAARAAHIMDNWVHNAIYLATAAGMVLLNAFFVAAEFGLVKVREGQLEGLVKEGKPFAHGPLAGWRGSTRRCPPASWESPWLPWAWVGWANRRSRSCSSRLSKRWASRRSTALHTSAFIVAFSIITTLHLIIGEQAPKIYAIRRPEFVALWCAVPLKMFYVLSYPFLMALTLTTSRRLAAGGHSSDVRK